MQQFLFAGTVSRRVLGSMSDFAWMFEAGRARDTLLEASRALAESPCSPIDMQSPKDLAVALLTDRTDPSVLQ